LQAYRINAEFFRREPSEFVGKAQFHEVHPGALKPKVIKIGRQIGLDPGTVDLDPSNRALHLDCCLAFEIEIRCQAK
jgi:hypothetical protein